MPVDNAVRELEQMRYELNLQIDNPLIILSQDTAKSLLSTSSDNDLYHFFVKVRFKLSCSWYLI